MASKLSNSTVLKFLAASLVACASVGGVGMQAAAAPVETPSPRHASSTEEDFYVGAGTFRPENGVQLGRGTILGRTNMEKVELFRDDNNAPSALVATWSSSAVDAEAVASIPILKDGQATEYYIAPRILSSVPVQGRFVVRCAVYAGAPEHGGRITTRAPFTCTTSQRTARDWDVVIAPKAD
jgi:hypothetical protein